MQWLQRWVSPVTLFAIGRDSSSQMQRRMRGDDSCRMAAEIHTAYLCPNVFKRCGTNDGEADEEYICLWV